MGEASERVCFNSLKYSRQTYTLRDLFPVRRSYKRSRNLDGICTSFVGENVDGDEESTQVGGGRCLYTCLWGGEGRDR